MPADEEGVEYVETILEHLDDLSSDEENEEMDFLAEYLNRKEFMSIMEIYDTLSPKEKKDDPTDAVASLSALLGEMNGVLEKSEEITELYELLTKPHVSALIQCYDDIVHDHFLPELDDNAMMGDEEGSVRRAPSVTTTHSESGTTLIRGDDRGFTKTIALRRGANENLGITVVRQEYADGMHVRSSIVVERILAGSVIDRQSLLNVGDIIQEVNNQPIDTPEALQRLLKQKNSGTVIFKIIPAYQRQGSTTKKDETSPGSNDQKVFMKTYFSYNPAADSLIPCREAGLAFECGEILEMVNMDDTNWWQARRFGGEGPHAGLVPSQTLEERRKAFRPMSNEYLKNYSVMSCGPFGKRSSKKKNVHLYRASDAPKSFQDSDILIYEEVTQLSPGRVPVLLLIGAKGIGRRSVKRKLIGLYPDEFAQPEVWTTRALTSDPADMANYRHVDRDEMEAAWRSGSMIEWGRDGPDYYGISFEAVRAIVRRGKTAVLDCQPQAIRMLRQAEFRPFVIFLAAPAVDVQRMMYQSGLQKGLTRQIRTDDHFKSSMNDSCSIERGYRHMFDFMVLNDDIDNSVNQVAERVFKASEESRWVPVQWAMDLDDAAMSPA